METVFTVGVGLTVIVKIIGVPLQVLPLAVRAGVTVIVAVTGVVPVFVAVKLEILPDPLKGKPILPSLLVQLYTILPRVGVVKFTAVVGSPLHNTWLETASTVAIAFT